MGAGYQITCVHRTSHAEAHVRLQYVGGRDWKLTQQAAIDGMEAGRWRFWVIIDERAVWVVVAQTSSGAKYLKTEDDDEQPETLLTLPECP